jgi:tyrosyl-tRNA synthetase
MEAANAAEEDFTRRFVKHEIPDEIEEKQIAAGEYKLADLMVDTGLANSKGEARRLIEQGGVKIDGDKAGSNTDITIDDEGTLFQVGKRRFLKIMSVPPAS